MGPLQPTSRRCPKLFYLLALIMFWGGELVAQSPRSSIEITVQSAEDLRPLAGARVIVEGIGIHGITDEDGYLRIPNLPPGTRRVEVRYLGFQTTAEYLSFEPGRPTRVQYRLPVDPIKLTGVNVEIQADILESRGFYDRQRGGQGTFLTRNDINRSRPRFMSDVLRRLAGIQVGSSSIRPGATIRGPGRSCPIQYFLDGALTAHFNIDEVLPNDVEGLEIYRGASTVPPAFKKGTAICGVILIWTRVD